LSFTGEYRHTIDSKGRLIVPSRLRDELSGDRVVLVKYLNGCIAMWSQEGWERLEHDLLELGRSDATARGLVRNLAASAHQDAVDRQGRISVPQNLRDYAGITRDVVVTGALDHGEVWNPDRWREQQVGTADLDELAQQLKF
jgi:MraZ protein